MKNILTLFGLLLLGFVARAQNGEITGKLIDENGEGIPFANVQIIDEKGISTGRGVTTDMDGNYSLKPLTPGKYNVQYSYVGYGAQEQKGVVVMADKPTFIDIKLKPATKELNAVEIISYKVPLIDPGQTASQNTVTAEEIANMATKDISDIAATTAGVFQSDQGSGNLYIKGARSDATQYYVDGIKVVGVPTIPATSIEQLQVITGGIPAKYGDVAGGIINITSKGPTGEFHGNAEVQTTQYLDAYGYNLANFDLTGPIWKDKKTKKTYIGFFVALEYEHQLDPNPAINGVWQVKPNVLDSLRQFPLLPSQTASGFNLHSAEVTDANMYLQQVKPNTQESDYRFNGRLDIRPADNMTLAIGGSFSDRPYKYWVPQYQLFNYDDNPSYNELDWKIYARFTHNIQSKAEEEEKEGKKKTSSAFQNAYYSVQVDYEKYKQTYGGAGGTNPFNYGYIGKFNVKMAPVFNYDTFGIGNKVLQGYKQIGWADTAVAFTPANVYPNSTRYTTQYYQLLGAEQNADGSYEVYNSNNADFTSNIYQIAGNQGLINGERSTLVNNIWYNTGRFYDGLGSGSSGNDGNEDQYRVRLEGAFDILKPGAPSRNKHSFTFGIEYEQRIERNYNLSPMEVWQRARDLTNLQLTSFDRSNPNLLINGVQYPYNDPNRPNFYLTDTILFNYAYNASAQSWFDKQLRQSLGMAVNGTNILNVDQYTPSQLNIRMFSPDNLLGTGGLGQIVDYRGYDPYGNVLSSQPSFNDFFTKTDANGNYIRAIPAYAPIYTSAYIQDQFYFKDLTFNVGLRLDRFDANQEVLKDPYTLYPIYTVAEYQAGVASGKLHPIGNVPSDIGANYAVYVNSSQEAANIVGYRNGGSWYDQYGNALPNALAVEAASSTGTIQPYLVNPNENIQNGTTFDPSGTFTQYKPQIIPQPRLQFSFNLTDRALFFAHYDILVQRPSSGQVAVDPTQYLFFANNENVLNNPDLQPQRTIDYELGFKQRVSNTAAFTISAFYREFKDQVEVTKIVGAYPKDYLTYGNLDFGTTKGVSLDFDMRRTGNFSMKANYTLQYAEGTGSDPTTQLNLITSNLPNFLTIAPLDYDARHLINLTFTWSYGSGKDYNGPVINNKQFLSDAGISLQFTARSGTPYTAQENATATANLMSPTRSASEGSLNGSRIPWYFRVNLKVWKDFALVTNKKKEKKNKQPLSLEIYLQIQNLLNTENVINVYRYTGSATSDGYLNDPSSIAAIQAALNPQAFKDQYAAVINTVNNSLPGNVANYALPRRIFLGGIFSF